MKKILMAILAIAFVVVSTAPNAKAFTVKSEEYVHKSVPEYSSATNTYQASIEKRIEKIEKSNDEFRAWTKRQFRHTDRKHNALKSYVISENKSVKERLFTLESKEAYLFWIVLALIVGALIIGIGELGILRRERNSKEQAAK